MLAARAAGVNLALPGQRDRTDARHQPDDGPSILGDNRGYLLGAEAISSDGPLQLVGN